MLGLGAVAQAVHLPLLARLGKLFTIDALADLSEAAVTSLGDRYGVARRHDAIESLLADAAVDAVVILTSGSHGPPAAAALAAGVPVFCEKPLAYTVAEADALAAAGGRLALGYMKLYDPAVVRAGELLSGRPPTRSVEVTVLHPASASQLGHARLSAPVDDVSAETRAALAATAVELEERALGAAPPELRRLYADVLLGSVVHELAVVRALVGDPQAFEHVDAWPGDRWPPSVAIHGTLGGDARLAIRWHYLEGYPSYREEIRVHDELGTVALTFPSPYLLHAPTELTVVDADAGAERTTRFASTAEAFEEELVAFHRLVTTGAAFAAGIAEGRADIVTCQRIVRCLAERRGLEVGGEAALA
ncbi:MAG: Gfo/Idh/MocA family oxidoreductase [Gaiellaceae bacterium]